MSSQHEPEMTEEELEDLFEAEEIPPEAFYLALKQALVQLENQPPPALH